ncbi:hypothetical protein AGMMS50284_4850 [Clostridia bacterium]|nr:hypothetical protein AGMMS50284_4850 [Clostridia bacterium]
MKFKNTIVVFIIFFTVFLWGCSKELHNTSNNNSNFNYEENFSSNYTIQTKNIPLKTIELNDDLFYELMNDYFVYSRTSSKQFMISEIFNNYSIGELREIKFENEMNYYCIFKNKNNAHHKIFLFFDKFPDQSLRCYDLVEIDKNTNYENSERMNLVNNNDLL